MVTFTKFCRYDFDKHEDCGLQAASLAHPPERHGPEWL